MTTPSVLALELTGTTLDAALVAPDGAVTAEADAVTPVAPGSEALLATIRALAAGLGARAGGPVLAVGLAAPTAAELDPDSLTRVLGLPTVVADGETAAAEAERTLGAAIGAPDCVLITLDNEITAVSFAAGRRVAGASGRAGQLGHLPVGPGGELCDCGAFGCLAAYASTTAIALRYTAASRRCRTLEQIVASRDSDPFAELVWREAVTALASALTALTMLQDPELIVLGGMLAELGEPLFGPLRAAVAETLTWRDAPRITPARFGLAAPRLGVALLAQRAADASGCPTQPTTATPVAVA